MDHENRLSYIEGRMANLATKEDLCKLRGDIDLKIEKLRGDIDLKIERLRGDLESKLESKLHAQTKWIVGVMVGMTIALFSGAFALGHMLR